MADVQDETWGDTGFDETTEEGFFKPVENQPVRRVVAATPLPPSTETVRPKTSRTFRYIASTLILLIAFLGGVLVWHVFFRIMPGSSNDMPQVVAQQQVEPEEVVSTPPEILANDNVDVAPLDVADKTPRTTEQKPTSTTPHTTRQPPPSGGDPLFVVQVYSSPSREDADEYLQMLQTKNVSDGYITEQKIKGQAWYRVRFGEYGRREDAELAAQKIGVAQPWIARIR